jgi:starch phosphorylase
MRTTIFSDFAWLWPGQILNITNGVTPRRWLHHANPGLATLVTSRLGPDWVRDLSQLRGLAPLADDAEFRGQFRQVKRANKDRLAAFIQLQLGIRVDPSSLFDVQVKRMHEYKRQLLNVLHVITRYNRIRAGHGAGLEPRTVIFSGKAAPGYRMAKQIISLIHGVANVVNHDPATRGQLTVVFVPNYSVSNAERIIPACDLSEQISTAGTEASGTGNMKLSLNGALTIGTLDGANVEMRDAIGAEHFFIFGMTTPEVAARRDGYDPRALCATMPELQQALDMIADGAFSPGHPDRFRAIRDGLLDGGDPFFVVADYASYINCQARVDALYRRPDAWARAAILNVAGMGAFSSDRTVSDYASQVWGVGKAEPRPDAVGV